MKTRFAFPLLYAVLMPLLLGSCVTPPPGAGGGARPQPCTQPWFGLVESRVGIIDSSGHGPDVGSSEWAFAVDSRLGIGDGQGHGPDPGSSEWCHAVDARLFGN